MKRSTLGSLLLIAALLLSSCTVVLPMAEEFLAPPGLPGVVEPAPEGTLTPVEVEHPVTLDLTNEQVGALTSAILEAGFLDILLTGGPYTILAPTDEAFGNLDIETIGSLTQDRAMLSDFIEQHVIQGRYTLADLQDMDQIENLAGVTFSVLFDDTGLFIDEARILAGDIAVPNAIVHVIDRLIPSVGVDASIVDVIEQDTDLVTLREWLELTGVESLLREERPFTLLAPSGEAIDRYMEEHALSLDDTEELLTLLQHHIIPERVVLTDTLVVESGEAVTYGTYLGSELTFDMQDGVTTVDGATVLLANITASNGMIHIIDQVLSPPEGVRPVGLPEPATLMDLQRGILALEQIFGPERLLAELLNVEEFTLFVPTVGALEGLSSETMLLLAEDEDALTLLLRHHMLPEVLLAEDLATLTQTETVAGISVTLQTVPLAIDGFPLVLTDFIIDRGVIHLIDGVLQTPELAEIEAAVEPEIEILPVPELVTPEPEIEITPTPDLEFTPEPQVEVTPTPVIEVTPTATPVLEATPTPDLAIEPTPDLELTPEPETEELRPLPLLSREFSLAGILRAIVVSGLLDELEQIGPFTLFGPSDSAVNRLPASQALQMAQDPDALRAILEMHIVPGTYAGDDLEAGTLETLSGEELELAPGPRNGVLTVNGANILWVDLRIGDVVIHIIDQVILPPEMIEPSSEVELEPTPDLELTPTPDLEFTPAPDLEIEPTPEVEIEREVELAPVTDVESLASELQQDPRINLFASLIELANLKPMLREETLTVLAPTDAVMRNVPNAMLISFIRRDGILSELLNHHIISGNLQPRDLADMSFVTTLAGQRLSVSVDDDDTISFGDATVIDQVRTENGTLYLIDELLLHPDIPLDVIGQLYVSGEFTEFLRLLEMSGLANTLTREQNVTVLAPTDTAFGELTVTQMQRLTADPEALAEWLEKHIINRQMTDQNLTTVTSVRMRSDEVLTVRARAGNLFIGGMRVIDANIQADNGLIHAVDTVVLPRP